ncbi:hypothetical protein ACSSS7_003550 [Eimeria intestinalis]
MSNNSGSKRSSSSSSNSNRFNKPAGSNSNSSTTSSSTTSSSSNSNITSNRSRNSIGKTVNNDLCLPVFRGFLVRGFKALFRGGPPGALMERGGGGEGAYCMPRALSLCAASEV